MKKQGAISPNEHVIVDVETTGFYPGQGDEIIEVAAQRIVGQEAGDTYTSLVLTSRTLTPEGIAVHGISPELLEREGRPIEAVMDELVRFIGRAAIVGHNIAFDMGFINAHLARLGRSLLANETVDTLEWARRLLILPGYSLDKVARYFKIPQAVAHRALPDVETTREVFLKLRERSQSLVR
ncbi:MAG: bifunctional ATP-dependent DNA helicase/DNA polymerase III subunit epsilon [Parcubacteria group bacterium GW2011_GWC2_49_9]|nr:MAG: bifunctional ATP-dependent DNA helicase/DNA polymerase III subunit epsilon [Parcubacteria group bacterium GW2011_GWA2_48_9]KKW15796.1 MAG: bifunctional ATP-dependent DNA helicase/DNA polymerase III subunit epsilon [Parcubacteria group bacterium GW2011_GWC2_49_9]